MGTSWHGARAIIIGAGLMGRHHAAAIVKAGSCVAAVVDADLVRARSLASSYSGAFASDDFIEACRTGAPHIAHICTPLASHEDLALAACAQGMHILIEKPLASDATATRSILDAFQSASLLACPVHQYAFQRSMEQAISLLPSLGSLHRISFDIRSAGGGGNAGEHDRVAAEIVPHPLSMIQRLLPACEIADLPWKLERSAPGEWLASSSWQGVLLSISISLGSRPTRFATSILASEGSVELNNFHDFSIRMGGSVSRTAKVMHPLVQGAKQLTGATVNLGARAARGETAYPGLRTLVQRFHAAVLSNGKLSSPIPVPEIVSVAYARDTLLAQSLQAADA